MFFGYAGSSQITCLQLMAKKIAVAQSTSGDVPDSGLDSLNQDGDSVEMALARQLIAAQHQATFGWLFINSERDLDGYFRASLNGDDISADQARVP